MSHKETKMEEIIKEMNETLKKLSEEVKQVAAKQTELVSLMTEVHKLKEKLAEKEKKITELEGKVENLGKLEKRVQDLELFTRKEDVIISGMDIKPRTYAAAALSGAGGEEGLRLEDQVSLETQVINFMKSKGIFLDKNNIAACHSLPRRDRKAKPSIIIRFVNRKHKIELLMQGRKLSGTSVYMNEHLTAKNAEIAREARLLKRNGRIKATWTRDCKVLIRLNGPSPEAEKVMVIKELEQLEPYR